MEDLQVNNIYKPITNLIDSPQHLHTPLYVSLKEEKKLSLITCLSLFPKSIFIDFPLITLVLQIPIFD